MDTKTSDSVFHTSVKVGEDLTTWSSYYCCFWLKLMVK